MERVSKKSIAVPFKLETHEATDFWTEHLKILVCVVKPEPGTNDSKTKEVPSTKGM